LNETVSDRRGKAPDCHRQPLNVTGVKMFADNRLFWTGNAATLWISSSFFKSDFYLSRNNSVAERERGGQTVNVVTWKFKSKVHFFYLPSPAGVKFWGDLKTQCGIWQPCGGNFNARRFDWFNFNDSSCHVMD
jgi:hypothetical protein